MLISASELQAHGRALRRLAHELVGPADAEDLVQDTLVVALQQQSRPERLLAWLAGVLRNLAGKHRRSQQRRRRREQLVAPDQVVPSADLVAELGDSMRRLTDVVLALPQPYREVVLLRYLHELPPDGIAQSLARPVATVKSQLRRGLAMLRSQLDEGSAGAWRASLAIAFGAGRTASLPSSVTVAAGYLGMMTIGKGLLAIAALLLLAVSLAMAIWGSSNGEEVASRAVADAARATAPLANSPPPLGPDAQPQRSVLTHIAEPSDDVASVSADLQPLLQLDPVALYAELARRLEQDTDSAEQLCKVLLEQLLTGNGKGNQQCMALLAAWLHSGKGPDGVIGGAIDVLDAIDGGIVGHPANEGRYCFTLAFAFDALRCGAEHLAWPKIPPASEGVLHALLRSANQRTMSPRFAAALAMSLQNVPTSDDRVTRLLVMIANSSLAYSARGSAITALQYRATPAELIAYLDRLPSIAASAEQRLEQWSVFEALAFATERTGSERDVLQRWLIPRLLLPATTSHQEALQLDMLQKLVASDRQALRATLMQMVSDSPSQRVRQAAQQVL